MVGWQKVGINFIPPNLLVVPIRRGGIATAPHDSGVVTVIRISKGSLGSWTLTMSM